jgi:hypothetical protein
MNAVLPSLFLFSVACSAPVLAPSAELAGTQPVGTSGTPIETLSALPPFPAWTTATPLTLVAPGGKNLGVLEKVGVRVEVLQIRAGRVHVRCTGCTESAQDAEGYLPRQVLWAAAEAARAPPAQGEDPLSLLLAHRSRWASGADLPAGASPAQMCWLADQGIAVDGGRASSSTGGGILLIQRTGASWSLSTAQPPTQAPADWSC